MYASTDPEGFPVIPEVPTCPPLVPASDRLVPAVPSQPRADRLTLGVMSRDWSLEDTLHETYRHLTGAPVEHDVRQYDDVVRSIETIRATDRSHDRLRADARRLRERARDGETVDALLPEVLAVAREIAADVLVMCVV